MTILGCITAKLSQKRQHEESTEERGPSDMKTPDGRLSICVQP